MKTINLLPKEVKQRDVKGILLNIVFIFFMIIFVLILFISIFNYDMGNVLSSKIDSYETVNMRIQNDINKLEYYESLREHVISRQEKVVLIEEYEKSWYSILYELSSIAPDDLHLTYIDGHSRDLYEYINPGDKNSEKDIELDKVTFFNIGGFAKDYRDLIVFMLRIEDMPDTGQVWLDSVIMEQITDENIDAYSFNISVFWDLELYGEKLSSRSSGQEEQEDVLDQELQSIE